MQVLYDGRLRRRRVRHRRRVVLLLQRAVRLARPRPRQRARRWPWSTGADIWEINASESVAYQYSRYNYNVTDFCDGTTPFALLRPQPGGRRASTADVAEPTHRDVQILGTNDFHGRHARQPTGAEAGAAVLAGAVKQLRAENPNTVFAAAGDLIGASTFESFIQHDKPTIDALNAAGLEVSAVGNHEFDQGYDDLVNRVMAPYDATTNPFGGAQWKYLGANVRSRPTATARACRRPGSRTSATSQVGFVGAVTEDLPELVIARRHRRHRGHRHRRRDQRRGRRPQGRAAPTWSCCWSTRAQPPPSCASATDPASDFGKIVNGVDADIDAIVSGPHPPGLQPLASRCAEWATEGRAVTERPVVSAGQYGYNLNQLRVHRRPGYRRGARRSPGRSCRCSHADGARRRRAPPNYPADPAIAAIVDDAVDERERARCRSARPDRRRRSTGPSSADGTDREPRWRVDAGQPGRRGAAVGDRDAGVGAAQIAFMNPGGLRADMVGTGTGAYPRDADLQAGRRRAAVRQHAGQHGPDRRADQDGARAAVAAGRRRRGRSCGSVRPRASPTPTTRRRRRASRITRHVARRRRRSTRRTTYSVTVNSFLAAGGDNFIAFADGTDKRDTGKVDLQAMVDYMAEFATARRRCRSTTASARSGSRSRPARRRRTRRATR